MQWLQEDGSFPVHATPGIAQGAKGYVLLYDCLIRSILQSAAQRSVLWIIHYTSNFDSSLQAKRAVPLGGSVDKVVRKV